MAADDTGRKALRRDTNLQYGAVACRAADMFLSASDGLWDTLDAVQNGRPRQFALPFDRWDDLGMRDTQRIVKLVWFPLPLRQYRLRLHTSHLMQLNSVRGKRGGSSPPRTAHSQFLHSRTATPCRLAAMRLGLHEGRLRTVLTTVSAVAAKLKSSGHVFDSGDVMVASR